MKASYLTHEEAKTDVWLEMAKGQGYVPPKCLLGGQIVMMLINKGDDPCSGCNIDRSACGGRPRNDHDAS